MLRRSIVLLVMVSFVVSLLPARSYAQLAPLPAPGQMLHISKPYMPVSLKGLRLRSQEPFKFDFLIDSGDTGLKGDALKDQSMKLIKYFLAALTVPEDEMWVNLSPYEKDRIIPQALGETEMGRDLLAQDYILKQLSASLTFPEKEMGKKFWDQVYAQAQSQFGTSNIPLNTFNKVWIVPQKASIYEHSEGAFLIDSRLKVMLEEDYLALDKNQKRTSSPQHSVASQIVREIILPALEKEINEGEHFANLRQIYQGMILATWYKIRMKDGIIGKLYVDQHKTSGIALNDKEANERIYRQYLEAFKKGVYNYIKDDYSTPNQHITPRKYTSGGFFGKGLGKLIVAGFLTMPLAFGSISNARSGEMFQVSWSAASEAPAALSQDNAMRSKTVAAAVMSGTLAFTGIFSFNKVASQEIELAQKNTPSTSKIDPRRLASVERMKVWLDDNVYKSDELGQGMPRIYRLPTDPKAQMELWKSIRGKTALQGVIERVIINRGVSTYDASLWQYFQAIMGNPKAAEVVTDIYISGQYGRLDTIRASDPRHFNYQGKTMPSKQQGSFFRIIAPEWEQKDPLTGADHFPGYPGPDYDRNLIVWADWQPITGENAWQILVQVQLAHLKFNGNKARILASKEFKLAESIFQALDLITSPIGAVYYAPSGTFGDGFAPDKNISTENNLSLYAALRAMYEVSGDKKYLNKMKGIENYLRNHAWDKANNIFLQGGQYEGGRFIASKTFASDVNAWSVSIMTPGTIDEWFGKGTALKIWQETKRRAGYLQGNKFQGIGYTDGHNIISQEWTGFSLQTVMILAQHYPSYATEAEQDAIGMLEGIEGQSVVYTYDGRVIFKGYKYTNERYFIPFGWWGNPIENTASTVWPALVLLGNDVFVLGGKNSWAFSPVHLKLLERQRQLDNARTPVKLALPSGTQRSGQVPSPSSQREATAPSAPETSTSGSRQNVRLGTYDKGDIHSRFVDFRPAKGAFGKQTQWNVRFTWNGPAGQIFLRLLPEGASYGDQGGAQLIDVAPGEKELSFTSNYPVQQLSFHFGLAWDQRLVNGEITNFSYTASESSPSPASRLPAVPSVAPAPAKPELPQRSPQKAASAGQGESVRLESWGEGDMRSNYKDFSPARGTFGRTAKWTIRFNWSGPAGDIFVRALPEGESHGSERFARSIRVTPEKENVVEIETNYPVTQLSFHTGLAWGRRMARGQVMNVRISIADRAAIAPGGIDLNKKNIDLKIEKNATFDKAMFIQMRNLDHIRIDTLYPVIDTIAPAPNFLELIGLNQKIDSSPTVKLSKV